MKVLVDEKIINRILYKAVEEILPSREFLKKKLLSGERLKIYQGFDPTGPSLHIGHSVMMRKLEDFRKLGHEVTFLFGDFTARIGDPTDKTAARKKLSKEQVEENLKNYLEQAKNIIDIKNSNNPVRIQFNSHWLEKLNFADIVELASVFTVQQMLKRSMYQKRLEEDKPIYLHEFMYPLMQGYDSVAMGTDVEIGGNDQLFNMLAGRDLVMQYNKKEKIVVAGKLLTTSEGIKMGKSEGNMIMLSDTAENIYGKVMTFPDTQITEGFELLTDYELEQVEEIKRKLESGENPMDLKKLLAYEITKCIKGKEEATKGQSYFESVYQKKDYEVDIPVTNGLGKIIIDIAVETGLASSRSEARRLISQNAVKLDDTVVTDWKYTIKSPGILKIGKRIVRIQ